MRIKQLGLLCLVLTGMFSCKDDNNITSYDPSKDAQIYSFSVSALHNKNLTDTQERIKDSLNHIKFSKTRFAIDQVNGIIYNPDSVFYGFVPGIVSMDVKVNTSYGVSKFEIYDHDSSEYYEWNYTDSVDFSKAPISFIVTAPYGNRKEYTVDLRIHKVDPDTIEWRNAAIYPASGPKQKIVSQNDVVYVYSSDLSSITLYTSSVTSPDPEWRSRPVSGLPTSAILDCITVINGLFCTVTETGDSYISENGQEWRQQINGENIFTVYGIIPGSATENDLLLVGLKGNNGKNYFGFSSDLSSVETVTDITTYPHDPTINNEFPVEKFTSVTNYNRGGKDNTLIVVAGLNADADSLNSTWLAKKSGNSLELTSSVKNNFFSGTDCSVFLYDDKLYVLKGNKMYCSSTWGASWVTAPNKQQLPSSVDLENNGKVFTDSNNFIWIFGGVSEYNIWKGRLNRLGDN